MRQRVVSEKKKREVELLKKYIEQYKVIGLVSMEKIGAKVITKLRQSLRGKVVIRMAKKRLMKRAIEESNKKNLIKLMDHFRGSSAMIFTDMNPIKLSQFLQDKAQSGPAKAGDIAPDDIVVPAGNTQIPPGPIISELNQILHLPTMIKDGMIHIRQDTVTHKKGSVIDLKAALLLGRLGIEPMQVVLDFYAAWENGEIIPEAVLKLDQKKIINDVQSAASHAFAIAMQLGIVDKETIEPLMTKATREANAIALELPIIFPDLIPTYFSKAVSTAKYMEQSILGTETEETQESGSEDTKKDDDKKDEEEFTGLGALFT